VYTSNLREAPSRADRFISGDLMPSFDDIFSAVGKSLKADPGCAVKASSDITLSSRIPYGIPTGIPELELAIGRPGIPAGRITEFYGFERSGKTTAALHVLASAQRMGGGGMYIDSESTWDPERAAQLGVDPDKNLAIGEVENIEGIFRLLMTTLDTLATIKLGLPFVIIVDSITGVESEINDDSKKFGKEARIGQDARLIRRGVRLVNKKIAGTKTAAIFINHAISNVDGKPWSPKSQAAGGRALKLFSTLRVQFTQGGEIQDDPTKPGVIRLRHGQISRLKVEKLKGSKLMFQSLELSLLDDGGFDTDASLLKAGVQSGWITQPDAKSYVLGEHNFPKADWKAVINSMGGRVPAYEAWLKWSLANDVLSPWNNWNWI